jgi:hypothetical protein
VFPPWELGIERIQSNPDSKYHDANPDGFQLIAHLISAIHGRPIQIIAGAHHSFRKIKPIPRRFAKLTLTKGKAEKDGKRNSAHQ